MGTQRQCAIAALATIAAVITACSAEPGQPRDRIEVQFGQDPFSPADLDDPTNANKPNVPGAVVVRDRQSSCVVSSSSSDFELRGVDVLVGVGGDGVATAVTWKLSSPPPAVGGTLLTFTASSADDTEAMQLRYYTANGQQIDYSVLTEETQTKLPGQPEKLSPREIRAVVPAEAIVKLGAGFHWSAELNQNTQPVNTCPA